MNRPEPTVLQHITRAALGGIALGAGLMLCSCDGGDKARDPDALYIKQGYVQAPKFSTVTRLANGGVRVTGRAAPDGRVRLTSDQNRAIGVSADGRGVFQIDLPPSPESHLYELAMEDDKRLMLAEGHLFVPPEGADHMVLLRSGAASLPMAKASLLAVIDYDQGGGVAVSGFTQPKAAVKLSIDGSQIAPVTADAEGRYSASVPLSFDGHEASFDLTVESARQTQTRKVTLRRNIPDLGPEHQAVFSREDDGWRIVWLLPGGGTQLSMVY